METNDKYKAKIKKLLELSMSDNEHEAGIASRQAMALMNKHNLTKADVYQQKMICKTIETPYKRIPSWYGALHTAMCGLSGCLAVYVNRRPGGTTNAKIQIAGRQRDVDNAVYLIVFLSRALEKGVTNFKSQLSRAHRVDIATLVKSYRMGFIQKIKTRMQASRHQFFTDHNNHNQIICIDDKTRTLEARQYYCELQGVQLRSFRSNAQYDRSAIDAGESAADQLQINNAVNRQDQTLEISY